MASVPDTSSSHSSSGLRTPPGYRQPIATIAIGSSTMVDGTSAISGAADSSPPAWSPISSVRRYPASTVGVG